MPRAVDPDAMNLKTSALRQALERLSMLGLINGDSGTASALLTRLISEALARGERNQENLILYAIGRFQAMPVDGSRTEENIMNSIAGLTARTLAFDPQDIDAMTAALDAVCKKLNIGGNATARELIALRIIELARRGERSCTVLQERLLADAQGGSGC